MTTHPLQLFALFLKVIGARCVEVAEHVGAFERLTQRRHDGRAIGTQHAAKTGTMQLYCDEQPQQPRSWLDFFVLNYASNHINLISASRHDLQNKTSEKTTD